MQNSILWVLGYSQNGTQLDAVLYKVGIESPDNALAHSVLLRNGKKTLLGFYFVVNKPFRFLGFGTPQGLNPLFGDKYHLTDFQPLLNLRVGLDDVLDGNFVLA